MDSLIKLAQKPEEDLAAYGQRVARIASSLQAADRPSPHFLSRLWLHGLRNGALRTHLVCMDPEVRSIQDLVARGLQFLATNPDGRRSASMPAASFAAMAPGQVRRPFRHHSEASAARGRALQSASGMSAELRDKLYQERRCFKCRTQGHLARDCPYSGEADPVAAAKSAAQAKNV